MEAQEDRTTQLSLENHRLDSTLARLHLVPNYLLETATIDQVLTLEEVEKVDLFPSSKMSVTSTPVADDLILHKEVT